FPSDYCQSNGVARDSLDEPLNQLRLAGLIWIAHWATGRGQGYALTPAGGEAGNQPEQLERYLKSPPEKPSGDPFSHGKSRRPTWDRGEEARRVLLRDTPCPVTRLLIGAQIGVFIIGLYYAQQANISVNTYLDNGRSPTMDLLSDYAPAIFAGQWWRLLTYGL